MAAPEKHTAFSDHTKRCGLLKWKSSRSQQCLLSYYWSIDTGVPEYPVCLESWTHTMISDECGSVSTDLKVINHDHASPIVRYSTSESDFKFV